MSKQKLAELVMQKMQQKKQQEEKNRPHFQVLQLLVKFEVQDYQLLTQNISHLEAFISKQQTQLQQMQAHGQELDNTGKKNYPRFIIKPDFIASEHVTPLTKQFYRKTANTFLREDLLKQKKYGEDCLIYEAIKNKYLQLKQKEEKKNRILNQHTKTINQKRVRNLKEDLRLRSLKQQIVNIQSTIDFEKNQYKPLLDEYQLKKTNLDKRIDWNKKLQFLISKQKQLIQSVYNPVSYREYLKKIFGVRIKNQLMHKNLLQVMKQVTNSSYKTEINQRFLQKTDNLFIQGKCTDSPSKKKRKQSSSHDKSRLGQPKKSHHKSNSLGHSQILTEKYDSSRKSQYEKTFSTSLGKTTASSTVNLFKQSSRKKKNLSNSVEHRKPKQQILQF